MGLSSPETSPENFGFRDLHGFKDFVGYVFLCAPDEFPYRDWCKPEEQMNLERAFDCLRYGLEVTASEIGETEELVQCRRLVDEAYVDFNSGQEFEGRRKLNEIRGVLRKLPSR